MMRSLRGSILGAGLILLSACGGGDDGPPAEAPPAEAPPPPAPAPAPAEGAFVDPNTATPEQLAAAPGMDATKASALVAGRPYANMTAVDAVVGAGLTDEQKDALYAVVWMPVDLNSASEEEFLLIPGVGDRMAHEFEEYRPYDAIERFRREIGKYVDEAEVARLEKYVAIK
jgi:DNA uptake protein ComE-like DNA-binding protein